MKLPFTLDEQFGKYVAVESIILFFVSLTVLAATTSINGVVLDPDALYHLRVAKEITQQGLWADIRWLPYTVLGDNGPDHHWLWHLLLTPFILIKDETSSLYWAQLCTAALMPAILNVIGRFLKIPYSPLFCLLAVCSSAILPGRFMVLRAQNIAILFTMAGAAALAHKRFFIAGLITFLFVESYHAAVLMLFPAGLFFLINYLKYREVNAYTFIAIGCGLLLGIIANPWFPGNVEYFLFHVLFKMGHGDMSLVGNEWYPVSVIGIVKESLLAHLILIAGLIAWLLTCKRRSVWELPAMDTLMFSGLTLAFLVMYHSSWRFAEYYAPLACITGALYFRDSDVASVKNARYQFIVAAMLCCSIVLGLYNGTSRVNKAVKPPLDLYDKITNYLDKHASKGEIVFNVNWPAFVSLVRGAPNQRYVAGLDGHYLAYGDAKRFKLWYRINREKITNPSELIPILRDTFQTRWIVIPRSKVSIAAPLSHSPMAIMVVDSKIGWLFKINGDR